MDKKQIEIEDIAGKTVSQVFTDYSDEVLIVFADGTFALLYGYSIDGETTIENGNFRLDDWDKYADELLSLGIIAQSQYDHHKEKKERYAQKEALARRAEYERLKAEFEGT